MTVVNEFTRRGSSRWHEEVPGARWFSADLHIHTLDDRAGRQVKVPRGIGNLGEAGAIDRYCRLFLQTAIARGVEVLGLTPHSARFDSNTSVVWRIVDMWSAGIDDDGAAFRDKIYAVFPGFEPSLSDGRRGIHFLFLFDPEVGRSRYLRAFDAVMGGIDPWHENRGLRNSKLSAEKVFETLDDLLKREGRHRRGTTDWSYLALAAHAFSGESGLFGELKSQRLEMFPSGRLAGLELGDDVLPHEQELKTPYLKEGMRRLHHGLFHASDAIALGDKTHSAKVRELGHRITYIKLAEPRVEALRQAFLAADSRIRSAYSRDSNSQIVPTDDRPNPLETRRPWLRSVSVSGGTSFFAGNDGTEVFRFNPDLTCIIGGSMTGKSTLLDGIRCNMRFSLPENAQIKKDVQARAAERFLSGGAAVTYDIVSPVSTGPYTSRWPAAFFAQRELQEAVHDQTKLRELIHHLAPENIAKLNDQDTKIEELDGELEELVEDMASRREDLEAQEEELAGATEAKNALVRFEKAGVDSLWDAQGDASLLSDHVDEIKKIGQQLASVTTSVAKLQDPLLVSADLVKRLKLPLPETDDEQSDGVPALSAQRSSLVTAMHAASAAQSTMVKDATWFHQKAEEVVEAVTGRVQKKLAQLGGKADDLNEFDQLSELAKKHKSLDRKVRTARTELKRLEKQFDKEHAKRRKLIGEQRCTVQSTISVVGSIFGGAVRVEVVKEGVDDNLDTWIRGFKEKGITAWWNRSPRDRRGQPVGPTALYGAAAKEDLAGVGMSDAVAVTFKECMRRSQLYELRALRCPDRYVLKLKVDDDYREMGKLSGGKQVSLLLSLLLSAQDNQPLVIDQPEDEIDTTTMQQVLLPALRRLKGERQVIIVTHKADIVVNGDADQVIVLDASNDVGFVQTEGAIENGDVRESIISRLDGGEEAFELRRNKYGF